MRRHIKNVTELGGNTDEDGGLDIENMADEAAMGGGRATGHRYFLRNWHDYYKYSSEVQQIGEAIEGIDSVFVDLVQNAIEPAILKQTFKAGGLTIEEERFIFYAGFGLDYFVPFSSGSSENQTQQLGNMRIVPPFRKPSVYDLSYYLLCSALKRSGMTLKEFGDVEEVAGKKSKGKMSASANYKKYLKAIEMAFNGGSGKPYDQVYGNAGKTAQTTAAKIKNTNQFEAKDLNGLRAIITKKIGSQGQFEKAAFELTQFHIEMDEDKSYAEWLPEGFASNYPKYAKELLKHFETLDIGLTILASKKTASAVRVANAYMDKYKNNRLIQRVAYKHLMNNANPKISF